MREPATLTIDSIAEENIGPNPPAKPHEKEDSNALARCRSNAGVSNVAPEIPAHKDSGALRRRI